MDDALDIQKWAVPFCLQFLHGNFASPKTHFGAPPQFGSTQIKWLELVRETLTQITPEVVGDLLCDRNWRTRICGAYFCGLMRWDEFTLPIGNALIKNELGFCDQGYCFALARFPSHAGANFLVGYLHQAARGNGHFSETEWAMAALRWIDWKMNTHRADEPFERLVPLGQKNARKSSEMEYRELPQWWQDTQHHLEARSIHDAQMPLAISADELQNKLREHEWKMQHIEVPEPDLQPAWFWKLMNFCEEHFDAF